MNELLLTMPIVALSAAACLILLLFVRRDAEGRSMAPMVSLVGCLASAFCVLAIWRTAPESAFGGFLLIDQLGSLASLFAALAGAVTVVGLGPYLIKTGRNLGEAYALLLLCIAGMIAMVTTDHLVTFFVGLETMSLALYVLSALLRERRASLESGIKYFLVGAFASGILLFGIALVYGATGSLSIPEIARRVSMSDSLGLVGVLLMLVGLAFKLALAPFHQWAPDVYEGAPTPITGFMSTTVKLVAVVVLLRMVGSFHGISAGLADALSWLAVLTMIVGNLGALAQTSVKRMLAYSSISHAGYIVAGVAALGAAAGPEASAAAAAAKSACLFYLAVYTMMNIGAFGVLSLIETSDGRGLSFADLGNLKGRHPVLAGAMLVFMLSLAGVPPTGGFLAKWKIFDVLVTQWSTSHDRSWMVLMIFLGLNSVVGLAYYLRVVIAMYMSPAPEPGLVYPRPAYGATAAVVLCAALALWFGFGPSIFGFGADGLLSLVRSAAG